MSRHIDAHLTDAVIGKAFEGTNFGRTDFRTILAETVMKHAAGFSAGWTAVTICMALGLLSSNTRRPTKLGLTFAFHHYYQPAVRDALKPKQQEQGFATGGYVQPGPSVVVGENPHERVLPVCSDERLMQHVEVICLDARQYESLSVVRAYGGKA